MISQSWKRSAVVLGLSAATAFAYADAPTPKWYDTIGFSGYVQTSYTGNLSDPKSGANTGREYDSSANSFNFNTFLLQIAKPVGDTDHYGFTVRLRAGEDAKTLNSGTVGVESNAAELFVQEAYITYAVPTLTKLSFIGGKFVTPEGFEGADTVANPNFSEGLLFTAAEPVTHTGVKANYVISDKVNATVGLVNGWDNPSDNNSGKTFLWQVATTPTKTTTWSFEGLYGKELADPTHAERLSLDTVAGYNPTDKLSLNVQGNWGQQTNDPGTADSAGTTHWVGAGLWASYATTAKMTESARFEVLADQNGADRFEGGNTVASPAPISASGFTGPQTVKEFTLTHKTMLTSALGTRIEYRHDWSNAAYFERNDGSGVRNQNTISGDVFVTF